MNLYFALLSTVVLVSNLSAEYHKVPHSLRTKAVYYKRSNQLDEFSCGYNVLFNAANFEYYCGYDNDAHKYALFKRSVVSYLKKEGHNPKKTSYNTITEALASRTLKLQPFYHLHKDKRRPGGIGFSRTSKTSRTFSQVLIRDRWNEDSYLKGIKKYLNGHRYAVVHFLCYVNGRSGAHGILVSVYKNETGRGLYVFDNLNDPITASDDTIMFLTYLCNEFKISSKAVFEGPRLPNRWPYVR